MSDWNQMELINVNEKIVKRFWCIKKIKRRRNTGKRKKKQKKEEDIPKRRMLLNDEGRQRIQTNIQRVKEN